MSFRVAGARDCGSCKKCAKHEGFAAFRQKMAGMGHLQMICKDAFSVAGAGQKRCSWERLGNQGGDFLRGVTLWSIRNVGWLRWFCMFMREVERSGRWFPERGYILEYQKCRFAKRILRSRSTLDRWGRKIAERIGTRVWVQHWSFHFWRKFRRSGSSLMLSTEVSQTCLVHQAVKKNDR